MARRCRGDAAPSVLRFPQRLRVGEGGERGRTAVYPDDLRLAHYAMRAQLARNVVVAGGLISSIGGIFYYTMYRMRQQVRG